MHPTLKTVVISLNTKPKTTGTYTAWALSSRLVLMDRLCDIVIIMVVMLSQIHLLNLVVALAKNGVKIHVKSMY
jgi:hypothetical protein